MNLLQIFMIIYIVGFLASYFYHRYLWIKEFVVIDKGDREFFLSFSIFSWVTLFILISMHSENRFPAATKFTVGYSDYSRDKLDVNKWNIGNAEELIQNIAICEEKRYTVAFKTPLFRRIFGLGKYKVIAYKLNH